MSKDYDLKIEQGKNFKFVVTVLEGGEPKNLTSYSGRLQIRSDYNGILFADWDSDQISIPVPANGQVVINVPHTETENYDWSQGRYDLEIFNDSEVIGVLAGFASLVRQVTLEE